MSMMRIPKVIDSINFTLMSPDDIRKMSVTKIITADTYDEDGYPIDRGLMDSRLGVVDPGWRKMVGDFRPGHPERYHG